jgi:hypothetical protein
MSDQTTCRAYAHYTRGEPRARGGTRHRHCKRVPTQTRTYVQRNLSWEAERTVELCGQHAAMFDRGERYFLRSDTR